MKALQKCKLVALGIRVQACSWFTVQLNGFAITADDIEDEWVKVKARNDKRQQQCTKDEPNRSKSFNDGTQHEATW